MTQYRNSISAREPDAYDVALFEAYQAQDRAAIIPAHAVTPAIRERFRRFEQPWCLIKDERYAIVFREWNAGIELRLERSPTV